MSNLKTIQQAELESAKILTVALTHGSDDFNQFIEILKEAHYSYNRQPVRHIIAALQCYVGKEDK